MFRCSMVKLTFRLLPWGRWRDFLLRRHIEGCVRCQAELASRDEARSLLVQAGDFTAPESLWPRVGRELAGKSIAPVPRQKLMAWRWAWGLGVATLAAVIVTGFLWLRGIDGARTQPSGPQQPSRFELRYVRIQGETANAFVYQPPRSDMVIVWAGK